MKIDQHPSSDSLFATLEMRFSSRTMGLKLPMEHQRRCDADLLVLVRPSCRDDKEERPMIVRDGFTYEVAG